VLELGSVAFLRYGLRRSWGWQPGVGRPAKAHGACNITDWGCGRNSLCRLATACAAGASAARDHPV